MISICNAGGDTVVEYTYDAWGKVLSVTGTMASTLGQDNPFRYRGYYYDTETGFYYLQTRYYDPEVGRFLNADAIIGANGDIPGYNAFAYCSNNPIIGYDPSGTEDLNYSIFFFLYWLFGDGEKLFIPKNSTLVNEIKKSATFKVIIDAAIRNYKHGEANTRGSSMFTASADGNDLYLSTQSFEYSIDISVEVRTINSGKKTANRKKICSKH